jgi:hypothetical protein
MGTSLNNEKISKTVNGTVGLIFGRFNPPHRGHRAAWQMASQNSLWYVGTNCNTQGLKDPLPYDVKIQAMKAVWPKVKSHVKTHQSWLTIATEIYQQHGSVKLKIYTDENWVLQMLKKYNGVKKQHGYYNFSDIQAVKTPRLASATTLRRAAADNDRKTFTQAAGIDANTIINNEQFFDVVKKHLEKHKNVRN